MDKASRERLRKEFQIKDDTTNIDRIDRRRSPYIVHHVAVSSTRLHDDSGSTGKYENNVHTCSVKRTSIRIVLIRFEHQFVDESP